MGYPKSDYKFIKFEKYKGKANKKYSAILENKKNGRVVKVHFGSSLYEHYKDTTGLGAWSKKNHLDLERRRRYRARHSVHLNEKEYSPAYFSWYYLW
jgi:hypothetical protein